LPNVGPYIYDVSISGFTRSSIYIYDISSLRVKEDANVIVLVIDGYWPQFRHTSQHSSSVLPAVFSTSCNYCYH